MCWIGRKIGFRWLMTARTRMGGATSLDISATNAQQITLVLEHPPELASDLRVIAPIAEPPAYSPPTSDRFERRQIFATDQPTVMQQGQQDEQVGSQVRQFPVALFILFPAELDPSFIGIDVFLPLRKMRRQSFLVLDAGNHRGFDQLHIAFAARADMVNLALESGLASIQPATVQKDRAADLSILLLHISLRFLQYADSDEAAHSPVETEDTVFLIQVAQILGRHFQNQVQHGETRAVVTPHFTQGRGLGHRCLGEPFDNGIGQLDSGTRRSPHPGPGLVGGTQQQEEAGGGALLVAGEVTHLAKVDLGPIGLALFHPIVTSKGELPNREHRNRLEILIGRRPALRFEEVVASLLDHIGHRHVGVSVFHRLTQRGHFLLDQPIVFLSFPASLGRLDQLIGEQRQNGLEHLLARGLRAQDAPSLLELTALLTAAVPRSGDQLLFHLLPSNARSLSCKLIQLGPKVLDDGVDRRPTRIEQAEGFGLHAIWQADGERKHLRLSHALPPRLLATPVWHRPTTLVAGGTACRTIVPRRKRSGPADHPSIPAPAFLLLLVPKW